ncbi:peptide-methionine (S)-S-oxide reductase MsrA [Sphingorhabdus arenilitoris]|uniref:peptide-methionine (S)-S-oxide reductase MsrA n=1 Tax=Sphingorhabdus arenilitoris TaxID=1490041 RepID=UPI0036D3D9BF
MTFLIAQNAGRLAVTQPAMAAEGIKIAPPKSAIVESPALQTAIFAGGCFWGVEGVFEHSKGVTRVESGYAGGTKADASYVKVSSGQTGHAEAVRVIYDPKKISYNQLLHIYFSVAHDPTQLNRQGPDKGTQYRSAIFPVTAAQKKAAGAYIQQLSVKSPWGAKPVTRIESGTFYPAESYHQDYMRNNPNDAYIRTYDAPKLVNLKRLFPGVYR